MPATGEALTAFSIGDPSTGRSLTAELMAGGSSPDLCAIDRSALADLPVGNTDNEPEQIFTDSANTGAVFFTRSHLNDDQDRYPEIEISHSSRCREIDDGRPPWLPTSKPIWTRTS